VRAGDHGAPHETLPFVRPGGGIMLRITAWPKVERVLQAIDAVEVMGVDPADAAPDHWRCLHNRLVAGEPPRPYSREQHQAWLLRRRLALWRASAGSSQPAPPRSARPYRRSFIRFQN